MIFVFLLLPLLYIVPGYFTSRLFLGSLRRSPFFYLFISFLVVPFLYTLLILLKALNLASFVLSVTFYSGLCLAVSQKLSDAEKIDLDKVIPPFKTSPLTTLVAVSFFLFVMSPRLGLLRGYFPIGDDQHQVRKIVSIAVTPGEPLFYHFPTTRLTIYYFNNVAPGLLTKFSGNFAKANQSWFIHVALETALILWLLVRVGGSFLRNNTQRTIFLFGMTYFSGLEFFLYKFKGIGYIDQLEWWSDWFFPQSKIHMQITNPFNLFFWVPQHLLAALLVLVIFVFLKSPELNKKLSAVFLAVIWASLLGNSAFVFISAALVYAIYNLILLIQKKNLAALLKLNLPICILALVLSAKNLELFLTAEKGSYIVPIANVFWFLSNSTIWGKIINFSLTVPLYLFVELGALFLVLTASLIKFLKDPEFRNKYLFLYLFIFLLPVIFVVKSLDDDNISMRSFIPTQLALSLFAGEIFGPFIFRFKWAAAAFLLLAVISLPSGLFDFFLRFNEQFKPTQETNYAFYKKLDENLPLNSIVFAPFSFEDKITALGHRFTFKDPKLFNATDREHTARTKVEKYDGFSISDPTKIYKLLGENGNTLSDFQFYTMSRFNYGNNLISGDAVLTNGGLSVYPIKIKF